MQKIFVIEDDENIRNLVKIAMEGYGYQVAAFETAEEALEELEKEKPDLAVFDLMLPGMDGLAAIRLIRERPDNLKNIPIIVLTAKDKEYDKVVGLDGGADDYMTKPFGVLELAARIRSLLRRTTERQNVKSEGIVSLGGLTVNTDAREVSMNGAPVVLTYKEYELLMYLVDNRSRVVERDELLNKLWDYSADIETRTLDIHIRTLRQKLGEEGSKYIKTVRSVGYRFVLPLRKRRDEMKRAIMLRFVVILLLALVVSGAFSYYFIGRNMLQHDVSAMLNTIHAVDYALDYSGNLQEQVEKLQAEAMDDSSRITVIASDGTVAADSEVDQVDAMENHLEREEVREAFETGTGRDTRSSESIGESMLYVAARSSNGSYVVRMAVPYTNLLDYMISIFPVLLLGTCIAFAVSVILAIRFADTITTPLNEISEEMGKVHGAQTDFSFKQYKYKELNVISETTMKMAAEIRAHMDQLEKEKKIRQEFFSNASHELKTPITSVRGYAELLDQGFIQDEATKKDFYARILKETDNMTNLINDILMISRLEAKEAEVTFSTVRIGPLLTEIFESAEPIAADYQVMLHKECSPVSIEASAKQLRELIMNLVSNGIKYNHPGGNVLGRGLVGRTGSFISGLRMTDAA